MTLFRAITLTLFLLTAAAHDATAKPVSMPDVLKEIRAQYPKMILGAEQVAGCSDTFADATVLEAVRHHDLALMRKIMLQGTAYDCASGADYVVIFPKNYSAVHTPALAKRMVTFPGTMHTNLVDFLKRIRGTGDKKLYFDSGIIWMNQTGGRISIERGTGRCYELMNALARKLRANMWLIEHLYLCDRSKKPFLPEALEQGGVYFWRGGICW